MNFIKNFPIGNIDKIKKHVDYLNTKLINNEFKLIYKNCICCNQVNEKVLFKNDRYGTSLRVVLCQNCGFVYLNPRVEEKSLRKFYESDLYRNIYHPIPNYQYKWNLANDYKKKKLKLEEYDPFGFVDFIEGSKIKYKDVYEIGAAGGANLIPFKILNKKVGGNELSKKLIKFSKNNGILLNHSDLTDIPFKIDLIIIQHVFEHLFDPENLLRVIYQKKAKYLYIGVPGFINIMPSVQLAHNFYFSFNTLMKICSNNGFRLIEKAMYKSNNYLMLLFQRVNKSEDFYYDYSSEVNNIQNIYYKFGIKNFLLRIYKRLKLYKINDKFRK